MESLLLKKSRLSHLVKNTMERKSPGSSENSAERLTSTITHNPSPPRTVFSMLNSVLNAIEKCVGEVEALSQDKNIKDLTAAEATEQFLAAFDINNDGNIRFSEYHISNQFLSKTPKNLRQIFKYFDKNHDWVISTKELEKSKPKALHTFLVSGKRK